MKKAFWGLAGIGIGGALAYMALRDAVWGEVLNAVTELDWRVLLLALGAVLFAGIMEAFRWRLLLPGERVSTTRLFLVRNTGKGLNNMSPVRVLAEVTQTAMLRHGNGIGTKKVVSSLVMAGLFDLLVTVSLVGAGLIILPQLAGLRPIILPLWGLTLVALLALVLLGRQMHGIPGIRHIGALNGLLRSIGALTIRRKVILGCIILTATSWMSIGVAAWLVAQAAGIDLPYWLMAIVIVAVTLFSGITPALPGAVGVYEFGVMSTLGLFAIDPEVALTFALVIHGILFIPPMLIGITMLAVDRRTMGQTVSSVTTTARRWFYQWGKNSGRAVQV